MKIDIDFDEIMKRNLNAAISASVALADKNPEVAGYAEQFEHFAKISAGITIGILRNPPFLFYLSFQIYLSPFLCACTLFICSVY